jgi:hypothetical protein
MGRPGRSFGPSSGVRALCVAGITAAAVLLPQHASALRAQPKPWPSIAMCAPAFGATSAAHAAVPPLREEELPWCVSADDPRCAPLHHDAAPTQLVGRMLVTAYADAPVRGELPNGSQIFTPRSGLNPQPGVQARVERPPRMSGRAL